MSVEDVWFSNGGAARLTRAALWPASVLFGAVVAVRNRLYDWGVLRVVPSPVPVLSVGNISVGGTGKTPVAAYFVHRLRAMGYTPAIVMRGYGDDEPDVHRLLNPGTAVYTGADRAAGIAQAVAAGANVIVLDDAFQHRRAARTVDVVLVSAERWRMGERVLPSGSLREPVTSLARASLVIVTHKIAAAETVRSVASDVRRYAPAVPVAGIRLRLGQLERASHTEPPLDLQVLSGAKVLAIAGVGDPESFFQQLEAQGALVTRVGFPDHHAYGSADIARIEGVVKDHKYIVSTLKDAVKLRRVWPPKGPSLWYVSQAVEVSLDSEDIDTTIQNLLPLSDI